MRLDLSMCARNIRRLAKNQEKRRSSSPRPSSAGVEAAGGAVATDAAAPTPPKQRKSGGAKKKAAGQQGGVMLPQTAKTSHSAVKTNNKPIDHTHASSSSVFPGNHTHTEVSRRKGGGVSVV